jgi:hypothetical protein
MQLSDRHGLTVALSTKLFKKGGGIKWTSPLQPSKIKGKKTELVFGQSIKRSLFERFSGRCLDGGFRCFGGLSITAKK